MNFSHFFYGRAVGDGVVVTYPFDTKPSGIVNTYFIWRKPKGVVLWHRLSCSNARCGDELIPVEVKYFENEEGKDPRYSARRAVMSAFSAMLPDREEQAKGKKNASGKVVDNDGDNPF